MKCYQTKLNPMQAAPKVNNLFSTNDLSTVSDILYIMISCKKAVESIIIAEILATTMN